MNVADEVVRELASSEAWLLARVVDLTVERDTYRQAMQISLGQVVQLRALLIRARHEIVRLRRSA